MNPGFGKRLRAARRAMEERLDEEGRPDSAPTDAEIGRDVAQMVARKKGPFTSQAVGRWFKGREPESLAVIAALGAVLEADPRVLAFGPPGADPMEGFQTPGGRLVPPLGVGPEVKRDATWEKRRKGAR